jgi:sugar phosphate isomerase/epimerase
MLAGICEFTTLQASFEDDLRAFRAAGFGGIGVCELKLPADGAAAALLRASGLHATACIPEVPGILPLPLFPGPDEVEVRIEALSASVRRLAELEPECVLFLTGPGPERRDLVVEGIRRIAEAGREAGVRVALEPVHPSQHETFSFVNSIADAIALLDEAGTPDVGLLVDVWHVGGDPDLVSHPDRIYGVHVSDRREPTRSHFDRLLPGDGVLPLPRILRTIRGAGYDGWYDVEVFSDDGTFGDSFPDSLWAAEPAEVARRARESLERVL